MKKILISIVLVGMVLNFNSYIVVNTTYASSQVSDFTTRMDSVASKLLPTEKVDVDAVKTALAGLTDQTLIADMMTPINNKIGTNTTSYNLLDATNLLSLIKETFTIFYADSKSLLALSTSSTHQPVISQLVKLGSVDPNNPLVLTPDDYVIFLKEIERRVRMNFFTNTSGVSLDTLIDNKITEVLMDPSLKLSQVFINIGITGENVISMRNKIRAVIDPANQAGKFILAAYLRSFLTSIPTLNNLAPSAALSVDSTTGTNTKDKAVDGIKNADTSRWLSTNTAEPHWFQLEWLSYKTISNIKVWSGYMNESGFQIRTFQMQSWNGVSWVDIPTASITNNSQDGFSNKFNDLSFNAVITNKIRMYITDGSSMSDTFARLIELEAWGYDAPTPLVDMRVSMNPLSDFTQGQINAMYTLTVSNHGIDPTRGTVSVTAILPSELKLGSLSGVGWACNQNTLTCIRHDALTTGAAYPVISVIVKVAATAMSKLANSAVVTAEGDQDTSNNTSIGQIPIILLKTKLVGMDKGNNGIRMDDVVSWMKSSNMKDLNGDGMISQLDNALLLYQLDSIITQSGN